MSSLIRYLYTDELRLEGEEQQDATALMEVIVAANELLAEGLKYVFPLMPFVADALRERAETALMQQLTLSNVIAFALFADQYAYARFTSGFV